MSLNKTMLAGFLTVIIASSIAYAGEPLSSPTRPTLLCTSVDRTVRPYYSVVITQTGKKSFDLDLTTIAGAQAGTVGSRRATAQIYGTGTWLKGEGFFIRILVPTREEGTFKEAGLIQGTETSNLNIGTLKWNNERVVHQLVCSRKK